MVSKWLLVLRVVVRSESHSCRSAGEACPSICKGVPHWAVHGFRTCMIWTNADDPCFACLTLSRAPDCKKWCGKRGMFDILSHLAKKNGDCEGQQKTVEGTKNHSLLSRTHKTPLRIFKGRSFLWWVSFAFICSLVPKKALDEDASRGSHAASLGADDDDSPRSTEWVEDLSSPRDGNGRHV